MKGVYLDRYERLLLAKRQELLAGTSRTLLTAGAAEGHGGDPTDRATEEVQTALQVHLSQSDSHLLRAIEDALARSTARHGSKRKNEHEDSYNRVVLLRSQQPCR